MSRATDDAIALVAAALQMEPAEVDETTALAITEQWTSLAHLRLILSLEEHLGRRLAPEAIVAIGDVRDVIALLEDGGRR